MRIRGRQRLVVTQALRVDEVRLRQAVAAVRHEFAALRSDEEMDTDLQLLPRVSCESGHLRFPHAALSTAGGCAPAGLHREGRWRATGVSILWPRDGFGGGVAIAGSSLVRKSGADHAC